MSEDRLGDEVNEDVERAKRNLTQDLIEWIVERFPDRDVHSFKAVTVPDEYIAEKMAEIGQT